MTPYKDKLDGVDSSKLGILFYDLATGWLEFFALPAKALESIGLAIRRFANKGTIKFMYSDRDPAIVEACRELKILRDASLPGRAETNSLIERQVGVVSRGIRALLSASGLPLAFWTYAASTFCHLKNVQKGGTGRPNSAWTLRGKGEWTGQSIPLGAYVLYPPQ